MNFWGAIFLFTVVGGPIAFGYSVVQLWRRRDTPDFNWRDRVSRAGLTLVAISVAIWPFWAFVIKPMDSELYATSLRTGNIILSAAVWIALVSIPVSLLGRMKLILPNILAAVAAFCWWISTTVP
jgi:hypothetical protein